jgi:O-antigen ligase
VSSDDSISTRFDLWRVAIRMIEDHPLVGIGPETFPDEFPGYSRTVLSATAVRDYERFRVESPHNAVLAVASGAGIPAAIAYLSVLVGVIYVLWHAIRSKRDAAVRLALLAVMAAVLGHVVTDTFMSSEITGSWLFWILVGAGVGIASAVTADSEGATMSDSPDDLLRLSGPPQNSIAVIP